MAEDGLHHLNIAGRRQHLGRQGASSAVRRSLLDTGLLVKPADGLLEQITGLVHLSPTVQLAVLERQFKSLALCVVTSFEPGRRPRYSSVPERPGGAASELRSSRPGRQGIVDRLGTIAT